MNCTNLSGIDDIAGPYIVFGIVVAGFAIVGIIRAIKGSD